MEEIEELHQVFEKSRELLYSVAFRFFQDSDVVDDVIQEVYIKIYNQLPKKFDNDTALRAWCTKICRNMCIDYYRKKVRNIKLINRIANDFSKHPKKLVEIDFENKFLTETIEKVLNRLNSKERMVYTMYAFSKLSVREIVEVSGVTLGRIRGIIKRVNIHIGNMAIKRGIDPGRG